MAKSRFSHRHDLDRIVSLQHATDTVTKHIRDAGAQNPSFVVFGFFLESYFTLHLLQNTRLFTVLKYLVSN